MFRIAAVAAALAVLFACEEETPCDRYADYMCTCHEGDSGFDCESYLQLAENPNQDAINGCQADLDEQKDEDQTGGLVCEV